MEQDEEDLPPIMTLPRDFMQAQILPLLSERDRYALSMTNTAFQGMFTPYERARMGQELFMHRRYREFFERLALAVHAPRAAVAARVTVRDGGFEGRVFSVLSGIRFVVKSSPLLFPEEKRAKVSSLVRGLGFDDILSSEPAFDTPIYNKRPILDLLPKLREHYGARWTPEFIAGLMQQNPVHWELLFAEKDPESMEDLISSVRPWARGKRPLDTERDWDRFPDRMLEYESVSGLVKPPGPDRPFAFTRMYPFTDRQFRSRFTYAAPNLLTPHPSYTQTGAGSRKVPPTFKLLEGHASPW